MSRHASLGRTSLTFGCLTAVLTTLTTGLVTDVASSGSPAQAQVPPPESVTQFWQPLTSTAGNFRVSMPSTPAAFTFLPESEDDNDSEVSEAAAPDSRMYLQMQLVEAARLEIYAVASTAASDFLEPGDELNEALLRCVSSLNTQTGQAAIRTVRLDEAMGIEAESTGANEGLQVSRCYLAGDRAYMISATSKPFQAGAGLQPLIESLPMEMRSQTMTAFLESFEILN